MFLFKICFVVYVIWCCFIFCCVLFSVFVSCFLVVLLVLMIFLCEYRNIGIKNGVIKKKFVISRDETTTILRVP